MQGGGGGEPISWGASLQAPVWSLRRPHGIQEVTVAGFCSCCWWKTGQETWVSTLGEGSLGSGWEWGKWLFL